MDYVFALVTVLGLLGAVVVAYVQEVVLAEPFDEVD